MDFEHVEGDLRTNMAGTGDVCKLMTGEIQQSARRFVSVRHFFARNRHCCRRF